MTQEDRVVAGRYRLGAQLGSGAMGVVWQAHDDRLHRTVAVKQLLLQPGLTAAQADEAHRRCMREGRIAARLSHPNAITVYDVAEHGGEPWLIMEYLPSRSLATVINEEGPLAPEEAARIGAQVASALVAAHAAGIVHRDVKPANVLLGDDGTVKITDFGISRAVGDITVTATGMLAGTPAYLAPEVAKGREPTAASDVFSLGSTLYTAVEGQSPFGLGENTLALLYTVAAGKVEPPRSAGQLTALLMRLLRTDPIERPSMIEAREVLNAVATGRVPPALAAATELIAPVPPPPVQPGPPVPPQRPAPPPSPAHGLAATRLDVHPLAEPHPSGPLVAGPPPAMAPPRLAARRPAPPPGRRGHVRNVVLTVMAIVAAALIGILVASLLTDGRSGSQAPPPSQQPSPTAQPQQPANPAPSTPSPQPTSAPEAPSAGDYENAVREYYGLLPANPGAGWELLTDQAREKSGGQGGYTEFWAGIASVEVVSAKAEDDGRVKAALKFVTKDAEETTEEYVFKLVERDGKLLIDEFEHDG